MDGTFADYGCALYVAGVQHQCCPGADAGIAEMLNALAGAASLVGSLWMDSLLTMFIRSCSMSNTSAALAADAGIAKMFHQL